MKKAISMMLATAMAATCLAGCGSAASSSAAASSEAASSEATSAATSEASTGEKTFENNELNIAVFEGGYGSEYWDEIIKRFEAAYPGVTVNYADQPEDRRHHPPADRGRQCSRLHLDERQRLHRPDFLYGQGACADGSVRCL